MKKVILIDGNNILFRSYYATAYRGTILRNSKGFPTNALYGFSNMINKILNETKNIKGKKLVEMVLNELSTALQTDNNRIIEILTYMASLSPQDIQKILVHSMVETMPTDNKAE